ncbi:hypothetical protein GCM10028801_44760 [Nocardioides maradonensis]
MAIRWTDSADKRGIAHEDVLFAMSYYRIYLPEFDEPRVGEGRPDLWIGPAYVGGPLLEVMGHRIPPRDIVIFHVMKARETTIRRAEEILDEREED